MVKWFVPQNSFNSGKLLYFGFPSSGRRNSVFFTTMLLVRFSYLNSSTDSKCWCLLSNGGKGFLNSRIRPFCSPSEFQVFKKLDYEGWFTENCSLSTPTSPTPYPAPIYIQHETNRVWFSTVMDIIMSLSIQGDHLMEMYNGVIYIKC